MSLVVKLMIGGWATTVAMIGFCALHESGKLHKIRERIALWLESSAALVRPAGEGLQPDRENLA
jgi:hypothetical protein